ncbi:hypothetical protein [Nonomuraea glycinis]|uniref:hypothetical protein n=1 Tax=Nonomuraea glycinis TaxID=2047744 RepID=UPI0033B2BEC1
MPGKPAGQRRGGLPRGVETLYQPVSSAADRSEEQSPRALSNYGADMLRNGFETVREVVRNTEAAITRSALKRSTTRRLFQVCGAIPPLGHAVFGKR